nr:hypothetical protein Iba_chr01cCG4210 [Ipomoea batatas]
MAATKTHGLVRLSLVDIAITIPHGDSSERNNAPFCCWFKNPPRISSPFLGLAYVERSASVPQLSGRPFTLRWRLSDFLGARLPKAPLLRKSFQNLYTHSASSVWSVVGEPFCPSTSSCFPPKRRLSICIIADGGLRGLEWLRNGGGISGCYQVNGQRLPPTGLASVPAVVGIRAAGLSGREPCGRVTRPLVYGGGVIAKISHIEVRSTRHSELSYLSPRTIYSESPPYPACPHMCPCSLELN